MTTIHELMEEIVQKTEELKKMINYKEDKVEDSFTSVEDENTEDPNSVKYPKEK